MANDYPFSPYPDPFSFSVTPEVPKTLEEPSPPVSPSSFSEPSFSAEPPVSSAVAMEDMAEEAAKKTALTIVFGVFIVLVLAGLGVWYFFLRDSSTPSSPPTDSSQEEPERESNLILAALGGKIVTSDGAALTIPAGALFQDTKLEISKVESGEVTDLYELKPRGLQFAKPVTVSIPYKESGLKKNETPYHIILEYWKDEETAKRKLKYSVDVKEKKLRTQMREF